MAGEKPEKLGKYQVLDEIARGSMGVVYVGFDPFIGRKVALKVGLSEALRDPDTGERFRQMFFNEAHTAGMLHHPNILDIFDAGIEGEICYLVMEYVEGGRTLRDHIRPDSLLPIRLVVEIMFKCAKALDYAHRQGVIHRDIKPSNLLLTPDNDVKIADFSIAHLAREDTQTQTMPLGFVGSPRYMSPEQLQEDYVTSQTDLFSLGVVFFELLTGRHPFQAERFSRLVYKVINEPPPSIWSLRPEVPEALERIVMRCLEKDCARRYKMGLDIAADLSACFSHLERPQELVTAKEKFNRIKSLAFFEGFTDSEVWEIIRAGLWEEYAQGSEIITEGDLDDAFYVVVQGEVAVFKGGHRVGELGSGDCFGEMAYLSSSRRTATIRALSDVQLLKLNATLIEQVSKDCQLRFCKVFLRTLIRRLSETTSQMVSARSSAS
ncbi:MAG: serine/threonine protein kinase [Gammaproteobacteria bacterium]|nr:MAG: serine/threonine protein kinase [Gammaproteobacteria bacterium]